MYGDSLTSTLLDPHRCVFSPVVSLNAVLAAEEPQAVLGELAQVARVEPAVLGQHVGGGFLSSR
jgi:hypothetical protein